MTDTPETDLEDDLSIDCNNPCYECPMVKASTGEHLTGGFVPAEFARRLERERGQARKTLTISRDIVKNSQEFIQQLKGINAKLLDALEAALNDWQYGLTDAEADSYQIARDLIIKAKEEQL
jgi:hypothetical protein